MTILKEHRNMLCIILICLFLILPIVVLLVCFTPINTAYANSNEELQNNLSQINEEQQASSNEENTYISGKIEWVDDYDVVHPMRRVMVKICDYDTPSITENLGTVYTDQEGNYSFGFKNKDQLLDLENGGYD